MPSITSEPTYKVLFVASECAPYAKAGGLADVAASLPKALRRMGCDVRIVMPLYASIDRDKYGIEYEGTACVHMGGGEENWIGVYSATLDREVPVWFVEYERFFGRSGIYDEPWGEYGDNAFRFALLSKAAMQICKDRQFIPDIMHLHDWPTAVTAALLKTWDRILSPLSDTASVLTIHNIGYQGIYHASAYPYIGAGYEHFNANEFEAHGAINLLKAGIAFADAITTVSPTYAKEIVTPVGGCGLAPYLNNRSADFFGILNGADYDHWNPETDMLIPARYTAQSLTGKLTCKMALQKRLGLAPHPEWPVFGIVSRFVQQKGFDLLREALPRALETMVMQVAVLGTGQPETESFFRWLAHTYPDRVGAYIGFSNEFSHCIEAGSDFFLMPSLYEPCGLNQIYSLKYGTLPIVRATGGLDDTVENYVEATGDGTGFKFVEPTVDALYYAIGGAVAAWFDRPHHIEKLRQTAMAKEFSWEASAKKYLEVYARAVHNKRS
ncbi:MAG TPA: glycogen synthase GlgA [Verrucomicrobia bacterium]|nr:glycogen synthase GlgA [Verrucomicrobiota bacterium]